MVRVPQEGLSPAQNHPADPVTLTFLEAWDQFVNNVLHGPVVTGKENRAGQPETRTLHARTFPRTTSIPTSTNLRLGLHFAPASFT